MRTEPEAVHMRDRIMTGMYLTACGRILVRPTHLVAYSVGEVTCERCRSTEAYKLKMNEVSEP